MPVWELSTLVYLENRRGAGALTFPEEPNKAPSIEMIGSSQLTTIVGEPITLSVEVSDDGYPIPRARRTHTASSSPGGNRDAAMNIFRAQTPVSQAVVKLDPGVRLGITWVLYRGGPGNIAFDPMRAPVVSAESAGSGSPGPLTGRAATKVTFSEPGTYTLRAYADDSVLTTALDVTVTVQPASGH
jgi:hypothetical protein